MMSTYRLQKRKAIVYDVTLSEALWLGIGNLPSNASGKQRNADLTTSDSSRKSSNKRCASIFGALPFDCNIVFSALAISTRLWRSETLNPVARMLTSIRPVLGSVADCFKASRCSLGKTPEDVK